MFRIDPTKLLGTGTQGRVYAGEYQLTATTAFIPGAIKITPWRSTLDTTLSSLQTLLRAHPCEFIAHITKLSSTQRNEIAYAMPLMPNGDLHAQFETPDPDFSWEIRLKILHYVLRAIGYLHHHRIAHRDIKPFNVLLDNTWNALLCDLDGSVKVFPEDDKAATLEGTPVYLAPEILTSRCKNKDLLKADIYSLGILLIETAIGLILDLPGMPETPEETCATAIICVNETNELVSQAVKVLQKQPALPKGMFDLIKDCTRFDPNKRPAINSVLDRFMRIELQHFALILDELRLIAERFFSHPEILSSLSTKLVICLFSVASDEIKMKAIQSLTNASTTPPLQARVKHLANLLLPYANSDETYKGLATLASARVAEKSLPLVSPLADTDLAVSVCRSTFFYREFTVRQYAYYTGAAGISLGTATIVEEMLTGPALSHQSLIKKPAPN